MFQFAAFGVAFERAVLGVSADLEEVLLVRGEPVAVVPDRWADLEFLLQPGGGVDEGQLGASDTDAALAPVAVGTESFFENRYVVFPIVG